MSTDQTTARRQLYLEVPDFGINFTAGTYSGGYVTTQDPRVVMGGSLVQSERYRGTYLNRPDRAAGDQVRPVGDISYGSLQVTINHDGAAWTNTTDTNVEIVAMPPDDLRSQVLNGALKKLRNRFLVPLAHGPDDHDMQASTDTEWDDTNASFASQTTLTEVLSAKRSKALTLSGAGGYTQSADLYRMGRSRSGTLFARVKADIGTGIARLVDASGNTIASVSFSQEEWLLVKKPFSLSSTQEQIRPRLLGTDISDQIDVQDFWFVKDGALTFELPSWLSELATVRGIYRGHLMDAGDEADTYIENTMEMEALIKGTHYRHVYRPGTAHPHTIIIDRRFASYLQDPLFVDIEQPWSHPFGVSALFSAETDTTDCPLAQLMAQAKLQLYQYDPDRFADLAGTAAVEKAFWDYKLRAPTPKQDRGWSGAYRRW